MSESPRRSRSKSKRSIFLPIALVSGVLVVSLFLDVYERLQRNAELSTKVDGLESTVADADKVRNQFDALVTGIARLSDSGNANAKAAMDQLNNAGVQIQPNP